MSTKHNFCQVLNMRSECHRPFTTGLSFRPLVQKKLEVLSKAGLSKEDFSAADTKTMKVSCTLCINATCKWWC